MTEENYWIRVDTTSQQTSILTVMSRTVYCKTTRLMNTFIRQRGRKTDRNRLYIFLTFIFLLFSASFRSLSCFSTVPKFWVWFWFTRTAWATWQPAKSKVSKMYSRKRGLIFSFLPRDAMQVRYTLMLSSCVRSSVRLSQVGVLLKRLDWLSWFLAWRLPSTYITLCYKEIRVAPKD